MTISASRVTVDTTAGGVAIASSISGGRSIVVRHRGTNPVYLGPSGVTTATGFQLNAGDAVQFDLSGGDSLFGIVASGSETLHVMTTGSAA